MSLPWVYVRKKEIKSVSIYHDYQLKDANLRQSIRVSPEGGFIKDDAAKSGFLCLPRRYMTKEFISVAGRFGLWYCGACVRHPEWLSDHLASRDRECQGEGDR